MGVVSWYSQLVQFLKNRLLVADLLARHPEIHDIRIARPIIICGLPRTGTTHLHNLIGGRSRSSIPALLGEPRAGAAPWRAASGPGSPTRDWPGPPTLSTCSTRPCRTSSACTT